MRTAARACALLLLAAGLSLLAPPTGAVTWPAPVLISTPGVSADFAEVVVGPDGTTTALFREQVNLELRLRATSRPPSGTWSAPEFLSAAGGSTSLARLAVAPDGVVTAVWLRTDSGINRVQTSSRAPNGTWTTPVTISPAGAEQSQDPRVAVGPDGHVTAIWARSDGAHQRVESSSRPANGAWSDIDTLSPGGESAYAHQITVGSSGRATVTWYRTEGADFRVQVTSRPAGGTWSVPLTLSEAGQSATDPAVAEGPDGATTLVWSRTDGVAFRIQASTLTPSGWTVPVTVSEPNQPTVFPRVVVGPTGTATALWGGYDGAHYLIRTSSRPANGTWSAQQTISAAGGSAGQSTLSSAPDGTALATWLRNDGTDQRTQVATRSAAGTWSTPVDVSAAGASASENRGVVGADGTAAILFRQTDGSVPRTHAIVVDDAFPPPVVVPETSAISGKKTIKKAKAKYTFSSPTPGAGFECRVDKKFKKYAGVSKKKAKKQVPWKTCTSPYVVKAKKLQPGKHKLYVRAVLKGVVDPSPSVKKVKVAR